MEVSVRRMSDPSLGKRRSSNPLVDGGVVVIGVHPGGLGIAAGVQLGDVIISVNHTLVDAHDQAIGLVDAAPDTVQLVLRAEAASYIPSLH